MCGIVGIYNLKANNNHQGMLTEIKQMAEVLRHRGPDDEGYFIDRNIALGHLRLSIIDLTRAGHQPMFYDNRNLVIVFNGEVYNYLEIRDELRKKGYKFKSNTDTEVILASYKEWGTDCLRRFNGMWSFVIYDSREKIIFAARDRIGVKPFYYYFDKNKFLFASEIKAILVHPEVKSQPNDKIVWDYLVCGLVDHSENTFFEGVKELRPGHRLILKIQNSNLPSGIQIEQYWDLDPKAKTDYRNDKEYAQRFRELFIDSVKLRLRSDVPIGTCLSGGLDSSAIVCAVNDILKIDGLKQIGRWQKTFSSVYDDKLYSGCDEKKYIREVSRKTQAKSHYVYPSGGKLLREIKHIIWHHDYPFASTSIYAQWNVFRLARANKIKVMLDGQGADELLAGYHHFFGVYFLQLVRQFKLKKLFYETYKYKRTHDRSIYLILRDLFTNIVLKSVLGSRITQLIRNQQPEYQLFLRQWRNKYSSSVMIQPTDNIFKNTMLSSFKIGLASLLRYEDRDSMAFSIESRVPFLDYRLVEYVFSIADDQKIRNGQTKWIMREALKGILPETIRNRQDKIGFATPEKIWIQKELSEEMRKVFASEKFNSRGYFDSGKTSMMFEELLQGKNKNYQLFWRLYCLEIWFRIFIDKEKK